MLASAQKINITVSKKIAHLVIAVVFGLACTITFFIATDLIVKKGEWYSTSLAYRYQTASFLEGKLSLFSSPTNLTYDYAFYDGEAQQVWGLGVPILRLPFEIVHYPFPDRITAAIYFFIMCVGLYLFAIKLIEEKGNTLTDRAVSTLYALTLVFSGAFLYPIYSLARTRFAVYEEAIWYVYVISIITLIASFWISQKKLRYVYIFSFMLGASLLLRPTMLAYALATLVSLVAVSRFNWKQIIIIGICFALGGSVVAGTNLIRFGKITEFGHGLNIDKDPVNNYQLKFEYPYASMPYTAAAKELGYSIFYHKSYGGSGVYMTHNEGQAPIVRWRNFYSDTFNLIHLTFFVSGLMLILHAWWKYVRTKQMPAWMSVDQLKIGSWGVISFSILFGFYLYSPSIASRYIADFSAAIFAVMLFISFVIYNISKLLKTKVLLVCLCVFLIAFTTIPVTKKIHGNTGSDEANIQRINKSMLVMPKSSKGSQISTSKGEYALRDNLKETQIFFNGAGWDSKTGYASSSVLFFMNSIDVIDMTFEGKCWQTASVLQAKIGNEYLSPSLTLSTSTLNATFAVPEYFKGETWPVFFKILPATELLTPTTSCLLVKINW